MLKLVVLSCVLAAACASVLAPFVPIVYTPPIVTPYNYRGPLSLAPGEPADIIAADGRPLDTLEVNLDRFAHFTTKALEGGVHVLKKRSAPLIAPLSRVAIASPLIRGASLAYTAPVLAAQYGHLSYAAPIAPIAWK